jgi:transcriptional regulator with XRE-family HTH domain
MRSLCRINPRSWPTGQKETLAELRRERERQGLSLTDMSERTGLDRATLSKLETGKLANPTLATLRRYAQALGKRLSWSLKDLATPTR